MAWNDIVGEDPAGKVPAITQGKVPHTPVISGKTGFDPLFPHSGGAGGKGKKKKKGGGGNLMDTGPDDSPNAFEQSQAQTDKAALSAGTQTMGGISPSLQQFLGGPAAGAHVQTGVGPRAEAAAGQASGYGFRDLDVPEMGAPPPASSGFESPQMRQRRMRSGSNLMDSGPDDAPFGGAPARLQTGSTNRGSYSGVQNAGILGYDQYNASPEQRRGVASSLGYVPGQSTGPQMAAGFLGVLGVPGAGLLADALPSTGPTDPVTVTREDGSTYTDARDRTYGSVGTMDAQGNVFSEDGVAYDPVTGQRVQGVFKDSATAKPHIEASLRRGFGFDTQEGYEAPPETAAEAGLMSIAGNDSISQVLDEATIASTPEIGRDSVKREINQDRKAAGQSYTHVDNDGDEHHVPAGRSAVTDRHGNAVTDNSGNVVTSTNTGGGGGNDDGGGGGGGGK